MFTVSGGKLRVFSILGSCIFTVTYSYRDFEVGREGDTEGETEGEGSLLAGAGREARVVGGVEGGEPAGGVEGALAGAGGESVEGEWESESEAI